MPVYRIEINLDALGWAPMLRTRSGTRESRDEQVQVARQLLERTAEVLAELTTRVGEHSTHCGYDVSSSLPKRIDGPMVNSPPVCEAWLLYNWSDTGLRRIVLAAWCIFWALMFVLAGLAGSDLPKWKSTVLLALPALGGLSPILISVLDRVLRRG